MWWTSACLVCVPWKQRTCSLYQRRNSRSPYISLFVVKDKVLWLSHNLGLQNVCFDFRCKRDEPQRLYSDHKVQIYKLVHKYRQQRSFREFWMWIYSIVSTLAYSESDVILTGCGEHKCLSKLLILLLSCPLVNNIACKSVVKWNTAEQQLTLT